MLHTAKRAGTAERLVMCGIGVERVYVYSGRGLRLIPDAMNCIATASEPHIAA